MTIELPDDATEEQIKQYNEAIAYLKTSEEGQRLVEELENTDEKFYIVFVSNHDDNYDFNTNTIQWDITSGLVMSDGTSVQSAALGLAHEMGHAKQDLDGSRAAIIKQVFQEVELLMKKGNTVTQKQIEDEITLRTEADNLKRHETPIAKQLKEPTRQGYFDCSGILRMDNSIHYRICKRISNAMNQEIRHIIDYNTDEGVKYSYVKNVK